MKEMEVGLKIGMKDGPGFFGLEQVNAALKSGASVISVREGALITSKVGEDAHNVEMAVTGFSVKVVLNESASKRSVRLVEILVVMTTWSNQPLRATPGVAFMFVLAQRVGAAEL